MDPSGEWLEADGLGGFASGTVSGLRTRRYHALLLTATTPPTGRVALVNGFDAWVETAGGRHPLSTQAYMPDVVHPNGAAHLAAFEGEPWPTWTFALPDGTRIEQQIFVPHERSALVLVWRRVAGRGATRLEVRPLLSGRDYHALHRENPGFRFQTERAAGRLAWRPYPGLPAVFARANGAFESEPLWYRNFRYDAERDRGLDFVEDLASPGAWRFDLGAADAVWLLAAEGFEDVLGDEAEPAERVAARMRAVEAKRRQAFPSALHRAADAYRVRRGAGRTIVAGYPWFTDWGRDTFIALRGLCLATGRHDVARQILLEWATSVSDGMLPNRFADHGEAPEYNSVDASLWYVIAVHELLEAARVPARERKALEAAVDAILTGYARGTRHGIRLDADGLLAAGEPGVQLTWMDAKVGDWVVTPRIGKPVEVQALWLAALHGAAERAPQWRKPLERGRESFLARFWNEAAGHLHDVVDVDHVPGTVDGRLRPNQILAVGGLPLALLDGPRARRVVDVVEVKLWTPLGLRSLAPDEPGYAPRYQGGVRERDGVYHQGTAWAWLIGPFVDAWLRVRGDAPEARREAEARFVEPLRRHRDEAGLGHVSEIADAEPPHTPRGCPFQAWSVGELLRAGERVRVEPVSRPLAAASKRR